MKVYAIDFLAERPEIESADAEVHGRTYLKLATRPLWNGCRATILRSVAALTPEDAVAQYVAKQMATIRQAEQAIACAKQKIAAARALLA